MLKGLIPPNPDHTGFLAGFNYPLCRHSSSGAAVAAVNTIYFYPFVLPAPLSFDRGYIYSTAGGAGSSVKGGIWANSPVSNRPLGAPLYKDNTGAATTGTGKIALAFGSGVLAPRTIYWFGTKFTGTLPSVTQILATEYEHGWLAGAADSLGDLRIIQLAFSDTYSNNMPTLAEGATFSVSNGTVPLMWLRAA